MQLKQWLDKIKAQHRKSIDLNLTRVRQVAERLQLLQPSYPVITVGGTNGKGSTVAGLEAIYRAAGYKVGAFTSPYLYRFNELVRVAGEETPDEAWLEAFAYIDAARETVTLTQFEFNTLAALFIFKHAKIEVGILEVGLGGRLDAVNIIDTDIAVITSIGLDHVDLLGDTCEKIAYEKAGIFRSAKWAVCGDFAPPVTLLDYAKKINAPLVCQGQDFNFSKSDINWSWRNAKQTYTNLPLPSLALQNMSTVLMTIDLMQTTLPVSRPAIDTGLKTVTLPGRLQKIPGPILQILDVSHNPAAAEWLADYLSKNKSQGITRAVFSMLADKDILTTLQMMRECIDEWFIAPLPVERGASAAMLENCFQKLRITQVRMHTTILAAHAAAMEASQAGDRVVVFGSFYTVAEVGEAALKIQEKNLKIC